MITSPNAKAWIALVLTLVVGIVGGGVAQGLINGSAAAWCTIVIGTVVTAAATAGVYLQRNQPGVPNDAGVSDLTAVLILLVAIALGVLCLCAGWLPPDRP